MKLEPELIPDNWGELSPEIRAAIVAQAEDRIWWEGAKARLRRLGPWASWLTVLIALVVLLRDQAVSIAAWVGKLGGKP